MRTLIQSSGQFHQRFSSTFFIPIFCQSQNVTRKSCRNDICTKNFYVKTLMKLTPGPLVKSKEVLEGKFSSFQHVVECCRDKAYICERDLNLLNDSNSNKQAESDKNCFVASNCSVLFFFLEFESLLIFVKKV
jgi:hypothetical protein